MRWACVGFGNVGQAVVYKLIDNNLPPKQILVRELKLDYTRNSRVPANCFITADEALHPNLDFVLLCVPDKQIESIASRIANLLPQAVVVHTSGSVSLEALARHTSRCGVVYPLQTFSVGFQPLWDDIPVLLEATGDARPAVLSFARQLVSAPTWVTSADRAVIHVGAVWAANFVNLMAWIAQEIVTPTGHTHRLYLPLMRQVIEKLEKLPPNLAQTGPAKRNDTQTIQGHLEFLLKKHPDLAPIYQELSTQIQQRAVWKE